MKNPLKTLALSIAAALTLGVAARADTVVYSNTSNTPQDVRFSIGNVEVGDEIALGVGPRLLTTFVFQYWGTNFSGNETLSFKIYSTNNFVASPTTLFSDLSFPITGSPASNLTYTVNVTVPDSIIWSVKFSGIEAGEGAGVQLYANPTVGSSQIDYWDNDPVDGWTLKTNVNAAIKMNFAAEVSAVPEPGTIALGVLGGFALLITTIRRKRAI